MRGGQFFSRILRWILPLFAVEVTVLLLFRAGRPWLAPALGILTVALGIAAGAGVRSESHRSSAVRIAELSAAELSGIQELARSEGWRSIGSEPIRPLLRPDRTHFLVLRPVRAKKRKGVWTVGCIALFYLRDGTARVGAIEMERFVFEALDKVDDTVRAGEIMKERAAARVHTAAETGDQPS
ncbi:hypothetical protein [Streptomyces sp. NPDC049040]|uniref:hypothetical protein n=1 Tax=Streptomyces sp. NPDC049040 TaxID=3365593 RepID=UPI003719BBD8